MIFCFGIVCCFLSTNETTLNLLTLIIWSSPVMAPWQESTILLLPYVLANKCLVSKRINRLLRKFSTAVLTGAIIGDGHRKRALILLLGLSPWYGTIFLVLEQTAPSPVAHARTCCEDFCVCREGEMTSLITEMFDTLGPQQPTTQYVHVCWNFASVFSSLVK